MTNARISKTVSRNFRLDVDLAIERGVTAIYGQSGAGKTLILETLAGFVTPDAGRILLDDAILFDAPTDVSIAPRLRSIGYIRQRDSLFPRMTLRRNLAFAARRSPRLERTRRIVEILDRFGLSPLADSRPCDAPPPQRLRAEVARSLLASPKMLMIDERGIDAELLRLVRELFAGPLIVISSDLDLCCAAADTLLLLDAGKIVQAGDARKVVDRPASIAAARALHIPNLFEGAIVALDPGRGTSRIEFEAFALFGPYLPGHFRGDRVAVAVRAERLRVHSGETEHVPNGVPASLIRFSLRVRDVRLEFSSGIFADISYEDFARQKENKTWQVEFPPEALCVL